MLKELSGSMQPKLWGLGIPHAVPQRRQSVAFRVVQASTSLALLGIIAVTALLSSQLPSLNCYQPSTHRQGVAIERQFEQRPTTPLICTKLTFSEEMVVSKTVQPPQPPQPLPPSPAPANIAPRPQSNSEQVQSVSVAQPAPHKTAAITAALEVLAAAATASPLPTSRHLLSVDAAPEPQTQSATSPATSVGAGGRSWTHWLQDFTRWGSVTRTRSSLPRRLLSNTQTVSQTNRFPLSVSSDNNAEQRAPQKTNEAALAGGGSSVSGRAVAGEETIEQQVAAQPAPSTAAPAAPSTPKPTPIPPPTNRILVIWPTTRPKPPPKEPVRIVRAVRTVTNCTADVLTDDDDAEYTPPHTLDAPFVLSRGEAERHPQVIKEGKYYEENRELGHVDDRWYRGDASRHLYNNHTARRTRLRELFSAWSLFAQSRNWTYWLAHGSLLGWHWNQQVLPWDDDIDVQTTGHELVTNMLNATNTMFVDEQGHKFFFDVNPNCVVRTAHQWMNVIDARFIDMRDGFMVDVTGVSYEPKSGYLQCKSPHNALPEDLFPLHATVFEGVRTWRPNKVHEVLLNEYKATYSQPVFRDYVFNTTLSQWVPKSG